MDVESNVEIKPVSIVKRAINVIYCLLTLYVDFTNHVLVLFTRCRQFIVAWFQNNFIIDKSDNKKEPNKITNYFKPLDSAIISSKHW